MENGKFMGRIAVGLLIINFIPYSFCGICDLCICTQSGDSRIIDCQQKREIENYTEIFDVLAFDELETVKKLIVKRHEITTLPLDAFRGLERLESLDLSENSIKSFEADIFKDLKSLEELDFSFNRLKTLSGAVFNNIQSLLIVNLSNNLIVDLNETTAGQLSKLKSLDLSHNYLKTIDCKFVKSLENLQFFDVSFNHITSLSADTLLALKSLLELRVSNNLLKIISGEDFPKSLRTLNIAGNMIDTLSLNLSQIRNLNVADNRIITIDREALWLKNLQHLNISGNSLTSFPKLIFDELKTLDLSRNHLSAIPENLSFKNLPILETLLIDGNPIKELKFIEELHLRKLFIRRLNHLEMIEADAFSPIKGIDGECIYLILSENRRLHRIEEGALNNVSICFLDLSRNAFTRISPAVIKKKNTFVGERGIDFQGNPLACDCQSQWMLNDLVPYLYKLNLELLDDLRCKTPLELSGTRIVHWLNWKNQVFCDRPPEMLSRMSLESASVVSPAIRLESSRGMLAVVAGATGVLCVLIIVGIVVARKLDIRKRRTNRRF